jgi:hypothetical protein
MTGECTEEALDADRKLTADREVSRTPSPARAMTTPWKTWMRERVPSMMLT